MHWSGKIGTTGITKYLHCCEIDIVLTRQQYNSRKQYVLLVLCNCCCTTYSDHSRLIRYNSSAVLLYEYTRREAWKKQHAQGTLDIEFLFQR